MSTREQLKEIEKVKSFTLGMIKRYLRGEQELLPRIREIVSIIRNLENNLEMLRESDEKLLKLEEKRPKDKEELIRIEEKLAFTEVVLMEAIENLLMLDHDIKWEDDLERAFDKKRYE